jgi:hypothetical protein
MILKRVQVYSALAFYSVTPEYDLTIFYFGFIVCLRCWQIHPPPALSHLRFRHIDRFAHHRRDDFDLMSLYQIKSTIVSRQ